MAPPVDDLGARRRRIVGRHDFTIKHIICLMVTPAAAKRESAPAIQLREISPWLPGRPDPDRSARTAGWHRAPAGSPRACSGRCAARRRPDAPAAGWRTAPHAASAYPRAGPPPRETL